MELWTRPMTGKCGTFHASAWGSVWTAPKGILNFRATSSHLKVWDSANFCYLQSHSQGSIRVLLWRNISVALTVRLLGVKGQGQGFICWVGTIDLVSQPSLSKSLDPLTQIRLLGVKGQGQGFICWVWTIDLVSQPPLSKPLDPLTQIRLLGVKGSYVEYGL